MADSKKSECGLRWKKGSWYMHVKIDGRKHERATGTTIRATARARRQLWVAELRAGTPRPTGTAMRFDDFVALYRERVAGHLKSYECSLRYQLDRLVELLGRTKVRDLRRHTVEDVRHKILTEPYRRTGAGKDRTRGKATANRYVALLQAMVRHAERWGLIERRHAEEIRQVKQQREENERIRRLTDAELDRLIGECDGELFALVVIAAFAGLRRGEILGLRWRDVDLEARQINLHRTKAGRPRSVPMSGPVVEAFEALPRRGEKVFTRTDFKKPWQAAVKAAGLNDLRFHDLRHTFASNCAMAGATEATLARLLGHTSTRMTKRYTHLAESHLQSTVEQMACRVAQGWPGRKK